MQGYRRFEKHDPARAAKVQPIFITIDPQRDTPQVLKNYVSAFRPQLIGLTGTPDEIAKVAKDFAVYYEKAGEDEHYLVNHSRSPYLMGPDGKPLAILSTDQPGTDADEGSPEAVAAELERWVKRSEEHTSELQSLMRISYAVFCLKKKNQNYDIPLQLVITLCTHSTTSFHNRPYHLTSICTTSTTLFQSYFV